MLNLEKLAVSYLGFDFLVSICTAILLFLDLRLKLFFRLTPVLIQRNLRCMIVSILIGLKLRLGYLYSS